MTRPILRSISQHGEHMRRRPLAEWLLVPVAAAMFARHRVAGWLDRVPAYRWRQLAIATTIAMWVAFGFIIGAAWRAVMGW